MAEEDLQLDLALSSSCLSAHNNKKRCFHEAFSSGKRTLPLFVWDHNYNRSDADVEEHVVGWPPVKSSMKKVREQNRRECTAANYVNGGGGGPHSYSMYVKVEMEGIGIARKIDLTTHNSYQSLTATLMPMFGKCEENVAMYKLTYQDKEGDWLLAGDVPWGNFIQSVRRLKLLKSE